MAIQYRYDIEARYLYNGSEIIIGKENIKSLMIDYEYENKNMPILLLKCSIDKNVIDDMVENNKKKYITLKVTKYIKDNSIKVSENYIYYQFSYFLDSNTINNRKDLDYTNNTKNSEDIMKQISIGLMLQEVIDSNKKIINGIHNNQTILEILLCYLSDRKILIEDIKDDKKYNNVIIPPVNTITQFIKYMNDQYNFYDLGYRLFYDFDKTYLLSEKGNGVFSKDEKYNSVIFTVNKTSSKDSKNLGVSIDKDNNCYTIDLDTTDIELYENTGVAKTYGSIIGIDTEGNTTTEELNLEGSNTDNVRIERTNNLSHIKALKSKIEDNTITVNITKTELDTTIFTINKEYYIKNYSKQNNRIGKFTLTNKREVYTRDSDSYILTLLLTFKKLSEE